MPRKPGLSRRAFVRDTGGLLLGFSLLDAAIDPAVLLADVEPKIPVIPARLDSWLRIDGSGAVQLFTGKAEIGMGVETAFAQIVAEELDVSPDRVSLVMGDTAQTPDQGGVGGSTSITQGAKPIRNVAATARAVLLDLASQRLGAPIDQLHVQDGVISSKLDPKRIVSFGDLAAGESLRSAMKVSGQGFALNVEGPGTPKEPASYRVVGTSVPRKDLTPKILGRFQYVTDVRVPGMLHGRVVRPSGVGSSLVSVNDQQARNIRGYVRTVVKSNFVGVVAETEWAAVQAAKAVNVTWGPPAASFPAQDDLYRQMRSMPAKAARETVKQGDLAAALAGASQKLEAQYDFPFQSHATMGPGCAVADVGADGTATIWSGAQKPHGLQKGIAEVLGVSPDKVRVIWMEDAGSYGRPGFEDAAADAALMSQIVGKPVRVQWARADMTAWGAKGPPLVVDLVAGLDGQDVKAFGFKSRALSGTEISPVPSTGGNFLAAQLAGRPNTQKGEEFALWGVQTMSYRFATLSAVAEILPAFNDIASPLRTTHLRDPGGPATTFAVESFIDELAAAARVDPLEFRLRFLDDDRARAVLKAAAEKAGWETRTSPRRIASSQVVTGRGIAVGARNGTYVSTVAEVEVNRATGVVRVKRFVCAHDCGLVINPGALRGAVSANLIQSMGRTLSEEITFDRSHVTSVDWMTYRPARASDVPAQIDIVLVNERTGPSTGAGEASSRPTAAAIGNAIFDATGARVRRIPVTPERVRAALSSIDRS
jgi:nicotinate dehydrogenase subunit B